jgi:phenylacetate-coenzyme A ligase PaaK-like adenylate-forming protein
MSYALIQTFGRNQRIVSVPATLPLDEIVTQLNELQPVLLHGYPSVIAVLAREAQAGRLRLRLQMVTVSSEPLLPEMRETIESAWRLPVLNMYATSEGASACCCGQSSGMHLNEDVCIFEPVNAAGEYVQAGERAAKLYITPLFNHVQPLIRYELSDEIILRDDPCPCGSHMRRIDDIHGRGEDLFVYPEGNIVHPLTFASQLGRHPEIIDYQVRQTTRGATIALHTDSPVDATQLREALENDLARIGLRNPHVETTLVAALDRQQTGKVRRFIPLDGSHPQPAP